MGIDAVYKSLFGKKAPVDGSVIELAEHGRVGGVSTGQSFKHVVSIDPNSGGTIKGDYVLKLTEDGTTTYIAKAAPGSDESDAVWQAYKLDASSGLKITFADGDANFDNVATDLTSLSYS